MNEKQRQMAEYTIQDLIGFLMEDNGCSMEEAMRTVFSSRTLDKLLDPATGLYLDSEASVYERLKSELDTF